MNDQTVRKHRVCARIIQFVVRRRSECSLRLATVMLLVVLCMAHAASATEDRTFSVLKHGAVGDGKTDDTESINSTIEACAEAGGGKVIFPSGRYLSGTIRLKSNVALEFDAHSRLIGTAELSRYQHFTPPDGTHEANNTMRNVATPVQVSLKSGNTAGEIIVERLNASGVYRAACSVESWTDDPIERFVLRDVSIEYEGGGKRSEASSQLPKPGLDARRLPTWGFFGRNINQLILEDIRPTSRVGCWGLLEDPHHVQTV